MAAQDLVTIASVRSHLKIPTAETDRNTLLSSIITRVSDAIMEYAGREFAPVATAEARTFRWEGGLLNLAPYDLASVTAISLDTDTSTSTALTVSSTSSDYRLYPNPSKHSVYTHLEIRGYKVSRDSSNVTYTPSREVTITGNWGFATVPEDVQMAALVTIGHWERMFSQYFTNDMGDDMGDRFGPVAFPSGARMLLAPYRRAGL